VIRESAGACGACGDSAIRDSTTREPAIQIMHFNDVFARRTVSRKSERIFYTGMSLVMAAVVFAGFAQTYFLRSYFQPQPLPVLVRLHGLVFTAWIVLFIAQTALVAARRTDVHRRLGWAGPALAAAIVIVAWFTSLTAVRHAVLVGDAEAARAFFAIPISDIIVFSTLVGAAIVYRRESATHKRLMLLATLAILDAAVQRWPLHFIQTTKWGYYVTLDAMVLAVVACDTMSHRRLAPSYAWGGMLLIGSHAVRELIGHTSAWQSFARMFVG
jgi:hypothetical protein